VALFTQWSWQPVAIVAGLAVSAWYARSVRLLRGSGRPWPVWHSAVFGMGIAVGLWVTCGFLQAYLSSLYWVWTTQTLSLLLVVPALLLIGQPLQLARAVSGPDGWIPRFLRLRPVRVLGNPLVGPALVPLLSAVLFFGPVPTFAVFTAAPFGWVLALVLVFVGGLILLPLLGIDEGPSALAVALTLAIGTFELVLDAIPGIVLRLHRGLVSSYFDHRVLHPWSNTHLHDQQTAGTILWVVAEVLDLPFLLLVFRRWLRADARDAAAIDAVLDAERSARGGPGPDTAISDAPWWLSDPSMRNRLGPPE
jgi:cytochrome c oxidase assembly factor CtaG